MVAVLQGLMSSKVELVPGGVTGDVTGSELAKVCQQSHVSVTGHNMTMPCSIAPALIMEGACQCDSIINQSHVILIILLIYL